MPIRQDKIRFFERHLTDFFQKAGRVELPWRKAGITAYEVWVSEIMLQQTQVARVVAYYERFLARFPDIQTLARAEWEEFLPYYAGLGYYARGRNMLRAATIIVDDYAGVFPHDIGALMKLPGIGPYTAAAIQSFAYGDKHLAWDTNLRRVVGRFFFGTKRATIDTGYFELKFVTPRRDLNAALMDFGSALCAARPKCEACPLSLHCVYYREKGKQEVTSRKQKTESKNPGIDWKEAEAVVILHDKHRVYYSSRRKKYAPFLLPSGYNTRTGIKTYFEKHFRLALAVRPPHARSVVSGGSRIFVNAQILLGQPTFPIFSPQEAKAGLVEP